MLATTVKACKLEVTVLKEHSLGELTHPGEAWSVHSYSLGSAHGLGEFSTRRARTARILWRSWQRYSGGILFWRSAYSRRTHCWGSWHAEAVRELISTQTPWQAHSVAYWESAMACFGGSSFQNALESGQLQFYNQHTFKVDSSWI